MASVDELTSKQRSIGMTKDMAEPHEAISIQKIINDDMAADEMDFHKASIRGKTHSQDNVWDADFLEFSKWLRKTYFKDIGIVEMQALNRSNFVGLFVALFAQVFSYWFLYTNFPESFHLWSVPLFFFSAAGWFNLEKSSTLEPIGPKRCAILNLWILLLILLLSLSLEHQRRDSADDTLQLTILMLPTLPEYSPMSGCHSFNFQLHSMCFLTSC